MTEAKMLTVDDIANVDDLPTKLVDIPAWGGSVRIKMLTKQQQYRVRTDAIDPDDGSLDECKLELGIIVASVVEPDLTPAHVAMLAQKNGEVVDQLLGEVYDLSSLDSEAVARARAEFQEGLDEVDGVPPSGDAVDDGTPAEVGAVDEGVRGVDSVPA